MQFSPQRSTVHLMDELKKSMISIRVDPEYRANLRRDVSESGETVSATMLFATNLYMGLMFSRLIEDLEAGRADMVEGSKTWTIQGYRIEEAQKKRLFYVAECESWEQKSQLYREIEGLETYRDFLRETVKTEA